MRNLTPELKKYLQAALLILATLTISITVVVSTGDGGGDATVKAKGKPVITKPLKEHSEDAKDETPAGTPLADPEKAEDLQVLSQVRALETTSVPKEETLATVGEIGCRSDFLSTNFSSRNGARPALLVAHYTVSPNVFGWGDVFGVRGFFNRSSTQASSNYLIDKEAHCDYIVRERDKAWTQGAMNPWSISIEFISRGASEPFSESQWRKGAAVFAATAKRWGIPIRRGSAPGCTVVRSGIVDHNQLGCGNDHFDISPFPVDKLVRYAREAATGVSALKKGDRRAINRRCFHRSKKLHTRRGTAARHRQVHWVRHWRHEIKHRATHTRGARHRALVKALPGRSCR